MVGSSDARWYLGVIYVASPCGEYLGCLPRGVCSSCLCIQHSVRGF